LIPFIIIVVQADHALHPTLCILSPGNFHYKAVTQKVNQKNKKRDHEWEDPSGRDPIL
jgi:hypothetical protein